MQYINIWGQPKCVPDELVADVQAFDAFLEVHPEKACAWGAVHVVKDLLFDQLELGQDAPFV